MSWKMLNDELISLLEQALTLQSRRHEVIAGNVANLDTPHYTRKDLDFHKVLNDCLAEAPKVQVATTHAAHLRGSGMLAGIIQDMGREVDLDQEMAALAQNYLSYQASVQMLNKKLEYLRTAIEGDRR